MSESPDLKSRREEINSILRDNQYGKLKDRSLGFEDIMDQISIGVESLKPFSSTKTFSEVGPQNDFIEKLVGTFGLLLSKRLVTVKVDYSMVGKSVRLIQPVLRLNGRRVILRNQGEEIMQEGGLQNWDYQKKPSENLNSDSSPSIEQKRKKKVSKIEKMLLGGTAEEEGNPNSNTALALGSKQNLVKENRPSPEIQKQDGVMDTLPMFSPHLTAKSLLNKGELTQANIIEKQSLIRSTQSQKEKNPLKNIANSIGLLMKSLKPSTKVNLVHKRKNLF